MPKPKTRKKSRERVTPRKPPTRARSKPPARSLAPRPRATGRAERALPIELDLSGIDDALGRIKEELVHWANKGRYTRVRFKFRGKQVLPDLPLAAFMAMEGITFYWGGVLRALLMNLAGRTVIDVELFNESETRLTRGKELLLRGELDQAIALFREAVAMDRDSAAAQLNLGIALKLQGDAAGARACLERARELDAAGPVGSEAERVLRGMPPRTVVDAPAS